MQGLGGEGAQLARQGEASRRAILGELRGPRGELFTHHELGNLQRTESVSGEEPSEEKAGDVGAGKWLERRIRVQRRPRESGDRGQDRKGLEGAH